jgi:Cu(I)/Ag(I) efflux system membrane protein CusA/SilA
MFNRLVKYFLENRLITFIFLIAFLVLGIVYMPFNWNKGFLPRDPIPVDAIPDIGENQQIVATEWMGRSPKDIQDQVSYPLTTALLGIPGVQTIRSTSMFGMSFIYIIFKDNIEFYWSRSRILEKLNSLPSGCDCIRTNLLVYPRRPRSKNRKTKWRMGPAGTQDNSGLLCKIWFNNS